jgi:hypothetical protein
MVECTGFIKQNRYDILGSGEMQFGYHSTNNREKNEGSGEEVLGNYLHFWSGVDKGSRSKAGISILIQRKWKSKIRNWRLISDRTLFLDLTVYKRHTQR